MSNNPHMDHTETAKENIMPLRQGKIADVLCSVLSNKDEKTLQEKRRHFENELRSYTGEDPLKIWLEYIAYVEENSLSGVKELSVGQLSQQCLLAVKDNQSYQDDPRFLDVWLKFASASSDPLEVFNYMVSNGFCSKLARFYQQWSWKLETAGNLNAADAVLQEGINVGANPVEDLYHAKSQVGKQSPKPFFSPNFWEVAASKSKPQGKGHGAPVLRIGDKVPERSHFLSSVENVQPQSKVSAAFRIFQDTGSAGAEGISHVTSGGNKSAPPYIFHPQANKENLRKPDKWVDVKGINWVPPRCREETSVKFSFYRDDEEFQAGRGPGSNAEILLAEATKREILPSSEEIIVPSSLSPCDTYSELGQFQFDDFSSDDVRPVLKKSGDDVDIIFSTPDISCDPRKEALHSQKETVEIPEVCVRSDVNKPLQLSEACCSSTHEAPDFQRDVITGTDESTCSEIFKISSWDPFALKTQNFFLRKLEKPLNLCDNFHSRRESVKSIFLGERFEFRNDIYVIARCLGKGAYATVYQAVVQVDFRRMSHSIPFERKQVALKVGHHAIDWEFYICSQLHYRHEKSHGIDVSGSLIKASNILSFRDGKVMMTDVCEYGSLEDVVSSYRAVQHSLPEPFVMFLTFEMLCIVSRVHQFKILHGDLKSDNFMVAHVPSPKEVIANLWNRTQCVRLIDFGRGVDLYLFPPKTAFLTSARIFGHVRDKKSPFLYEGDWFSLAGTIHNLLFGKYMRVDKTDKGVNVLAQRFKRYCYTEDLWRPLFHKLLNITLEDGELDVMPFLQFIASKLNAQDLKLPLARLKNMKQC